tara:strand:- start:71 stop:397 length:327 start_codon:yes stop_codon:yes gene_type:complete
MDTSISIEEKKEILPTVNRSQSIERKILEHKLKIEDDKYADTWKSCCILLDRRAVQYFTQIIVIGGTMGFCISKLYFNESCEAQKTYLGLLTLLLGVLIPNPKFSDKV